MKLIIAIIQPTRLEAVKAALTEVEVFRLTVMDVQGFGRQKGHTEVYRGHEIAVNLLRKVQLQIAVNDEFVEPTVGAIIKGGRTGKSGEIGDGKIFVLPMDDCIRIRTGERGGEAIYAPRRGQNESHARGRPPAQAPGFLAAPTRRRLARFPAGRHDQPPMLQSTPA